MTINFKNLELNNILKEVISNNKINRDNLCSICKSPLLLDTVVLNCKHRYHSECINQTFIKWKERKCPLCQELILWNSYKTTCIIKKKNGIICDKSCYNDERMCKLHINSHLRMIEKEKIQIKKRKIKTGKAIKKKINSKQKQIDKLKEKINILQNEIKILQLNTEDISSDI